MKERELQLLGWTKAAGYWFHKSDTGYLHTRAHSLSEAIQRSQKAKEEGKEIGEVSVLPARTMQDGVEMGFLNPRPGFWREYVKNE